MRVSILQMHVTIGDRNRNYSRLKRMMEEAMRGVGENSRPDVILLSELWDVGFYPKPLDDYADKGGSATREILSTLAAKYSVNIVGGSCVIKTGHDIRNECLVMNRKGELIANYDKTHLFSPAKEGKAFKRGDHLSIFTLDGAKCGVIICYDLRFPELIRKLALSDISVLFVPAAWPTERLAHCRTLLEARAIENEIFIAAANGSGTFATGVPLAGHSMLLDPWGKIMDESKLDETIISADFDLAMREAIKSKIDVFADRREDLY